LLLLATAQQIGDDLLDSSDCCIEEMEGKLYDFSFFLWWHTIPQPLPQDRVGGNRREE